MNDYYFLSSKQADGVVTLWICVREVLGSILGGDMATLTEIFCDPQGICGDRTFKLPSKSFPIVALRVILSFSYVIF
jgi:hypothetical protein